MGHLAWENTPCQDDWDELYEFYCWDEVNEELCENWTDYGTGGAPLANVKSNCPKCGALVKAEARYEY